MGIAICTLLAGGASLAQAPAEAWEIGPIIKGRNYSVGIGGTLRSSVQGPTFDFPSEGAGHIHYTTLRTGSLAGARTITLRYRVDAGPGAQFIAQESGAPGTVGIAFQRAGDTWSGRGRFSEFRWYSPTVADLKPGSNTLTVRLDDPRWVSVDGRPAGGSPEGFAAAIDQADNVSLTFGSSAARGHGVFATGPAKFTILDFRVE